ncbi:transglutaminase domain-containing protein [Jannaschia sp. LMIT008]|uniref:transglutaminase-like domain-containing protein n=1 Tax=Jannaschia maritima TaxID=3032585 RepID=UPI002811FD22|nr:transglutaminase domain-containing protein [Jannaschia sp. LMIT008]
MTIEARLAYDLSGTVDCLMQIEAAHVAGQTIMEESLRTTPVEGFDRIAGDVALGTRAWFAAEGRLEVSYDAVVEVTRPKVDLSALRARRARTLNAEATPFLMASRYCHSDDFVPFVTSRFGDKGGGPLVQAIRDWVHAEMDYVPGASDARTTATDTFVSRQGVCRDYAHVVIAMCRAGGIPARTVSVYAPHVDPPDFHAVAEVYLDGAWHIVDATGMAGPDEVAIVGVGRDAADTSFLTMMGAGTLVEQSVKVTEG